MRIAIIIKKIQEREFNFYYDTPFGCPPRGKGEWPRLKLLGHANFMLNKWVQDSKKFRFKSDI